MIDVRVSKQEWCVGDIVERVANKTLFVENLIDAACWSDAPISLLMESFLLHVPAPSIYVQTVESVDQKPVFGTVGKFSKSYVHALCDIEHKVCFVDLTILPQLNGLTFDELVRPLQRKIRETRIPVRIIDEGVYYVLELIERGII